MKWEALLKRSISIGADFIATGHYARVEQLSNGRYALRRSATAAKDQTYALYNLTQEQLKRTLMPVGEYTKEEVRVIAEKIGLLVADKPDSQDICFVQDGNYAAFIEEHTGKKASEGNFVTSDGTVIGRHKGLSIIRSVRERDLVWHLDIRHLFLKSVRKRMRSLSELMKNL